MADCYSSTNLPGSSEITQLSISTSSFMGKVELNPFRGFSNVRNHTNDMENYLYNPFFQDKRIQKLIYNRFGTKAEII